jgi:hypothetical protein
VEESGGGRAADGERPQRDEDLIRMSGLNKF